PPLQNLSIEQLAPGRRVALLVGMSGSSHWSASIESVPGQSAFVFDIACRTTRGGASLGSLYRIHVPDDVRYALVSELTCDVQPDAPDRMAVTPTGKGHSNS